MDIILIITQIILIWLLLILGCLILYGIIVCIYFIGKEIIIYSCKKINGRCCILFINDKNDIYNDDCVV
jgi:hypothetical protein